MHVNARSSNPNPNHVLDRDPKCLSNVILAHVNTACITQGCSQPWSILRGEKSFQVLYLQLGQERQYCGEMHCLGVCTLGGCEPPTL